MRYDGKPRMSEPANRMTPARAGVRPMMERTVVVLPMPLRPISVTISPEATVSVRPNRTWLRPSLVSMSRTSRMASGMRGLRLAEISLAHLRVGADRGRAAGRNSAAIDQHGDPVGQREYRLHVVLDQ